MPSPTMERPEYQPKNGLDFGGHPTDLAKTRFALARALWDAPVDSGRDRPRARELAEQADVAYAAAGDKASEALTEVRDWLTAHAL